MSFKVKFWGVRGSIACPSPNHVLFGGNTSCVEVTAGGQRIILDAGTGVRNLGNWFIKKKVRGAHLLQSHTHWDHINGFPFFAPAFTKDFELIIMAGHVTEEGGIKKIMAGQMAQPVFPVPLEALHSKLVFEDFSAGDSFKIGKSISIRTTPLNHPGCATGYRIEYMGKAVCYITDTEHIPNQPDQNILGLIEGADLVIYDSTYTDEEFGERVGWGHSTWQEGVRLCRVANVPNLAIFHHDPDHEDQRMERLEAEARLMWPGTIVARENMRINLL